MRCVYFKWIKKKKRRRRTEIMMAMLKENECIIFARHLQFYSIFNEQFEIICACGALIYYSAIDSKSIVRNQQWNKQKKKKT